MFYFKFEKSRKRSNGWGTWIRTKILGVRVRCSTVELSPTEAIDLSTVLTAVLQIRGDVLQIDPADALI
jgi:hypothetical protein